MPMGLYHRFELHNLRQERSFIMIFHFLLTIIFLTVPATSVVAGGETVTFVQKIDQGFGGSQSADEARASGIAKGKADALEKAGTYVESMTVVEEFVLKKDEVMALAAGVVNTEIVSQKNYGTDNGFGMMLELRVEVDKSILANRLEEIKTDRVLLRKYTELQTRETELLARIKQLETLTRTGKNKTASNKEATSRYRSAIQSLPAVELNRKALNLWKDGRFSDPKKAMEFLDQALALDPGNTTTINNRGVAYYQLGQRQSALDEFNKAVKTAPDYGDAYNNRAIVYLAMQKYSMAEQDFSRVLELMPMRVDAYINRAVARKNLLQHQLALEDYKRALLIDPNHSRQQRQEDSASLNYNELERICQKAYTACSLGLCKSLSYLKSKEFCE